MDPEVYIPLYLERAYLDAHPDLTPAARELVHADVRTNTMRYATTATAKSLISYASIRARLVGDLRRAEELPDGKFEQRREELLTQAQVDLEALCREDTAPIDAQLLEVMLANTSLESSVRNVLRLEKAVRERLASSLAGFDADAEHYWSEETFARPVATAAELTRTSPDLIGWLHINEVLAQLCMASARYRMAIAYTERVLAAEGYENHAEGTAFLALARLEDEEGFFALAHRLEARAEASGAPGSAAYLVDESPWYLLARTILLYKLGHRKSARRALRDFSARCEGGAFFLLNPTYMTPYLPVRPQPSESWGRSHQAVWDADGILADTPDFAVWAEGVDGIYEASESFADRNGF